MAARDKLRTNAAPFLQPGEVIQEVLIGQTANPYWSIISYWIIVFKNAYRVLVVTDRRIVICSSGRLSPAAINGVLAEFPRQTQLGPASGLWHKCETLGEPLYIAKRFFKDVAAADAALATGTPPAPPAPPAV
jgi:hypothetical protein